MTTLLLLFILAACDGTGSTPLSDSAVAPPPAVSLPVPLEPTTVPPPATWACIHNGQTRLCYADGTLVGEQDELAWDQNAPSKAAMAKDPTLLIRYRKVRRLTMHQTTPDGKALTPDQINQLAAEAHQLNARRAMVAAAADAKAAAQ